jgi:hypothetical protein
VAVACLAMGAVGCSSDSKSGTSTDTSASAKSSRTDNGTTEAELKTAASAFATKLVEEDSSSYDYLTAACKTKFSSSQWDANISQIAAIVNPALPGIADAKAGPVATRNVTPVSGEAQVVLQAKDGTDLIGADKAQWGKWVVENGMWFTSDCTAASDVIAGGT